MNWALVNGDYEYALYRDEIGPTPESKISQNQNDSEFIFFYLNSDPHLGLHSTQVYRDEYLRKLEALGLAIPKIAKVENPTPWLGKLKDLPHEKKLNSKIWSYRILGELGLSPGPHFEVLTKEEILEAVSGRTENRWVIKSPYLMSGLGFRSFSLTEPPPDLPYVHLLEPWYERIIDLSWLYSWEDQSVQFYINRISPSGQYVGGIIFNREDDLEEYLGHKGLGNCYNKLRETSSVILSRLKKENLRQMLSVDTFIYQSASGPALHPMCEINYRYSMGALLTQLRRFTPDAGVGAFYLLKKIPGVRYDHVLPWNQETKKGILTLTHPDATNLAIFITGKTLEETEKVGKFFLHTVGVA